MSPVTPVHTCHQSPWSTHVTSHPGPHMSPVTPATIHQSPQSTHVTSHPGPHMSPVTPVHTCHQSPWSTHVTSHPGPHMSPVTPVHTCHQSPRSTHVTSHPGPHMSPVTLVHTCHQSPWSTHVCTSQVNHYRSWLINRTPLECCIYNEISEQSHHRQLHLSFLPLSPLHRSHRDCDGIIYLVLIDLTQSN